MNCLLCNKEGVHRVRWYGIADEYQDLIKDKAWHAWYHCRTCDFYMSDNSETQKERRKIYRRYWEEDLRGTTVEDFFSEVYSRQLKLNAERIGWITLQSPFDANTKILDVGSGYATFPYTFKRINQKIKCIEPEPTVAKFINNDLGMPCVQSFYDDYETDEKFSLITMSNVLEHFENPIEMLKKARGQLADGGSIYIEVPEASEFDYLPEDHDDFNSLHLWFFSEKSLKKILHMSGLTVKKIEVGVYKGFYNSKIKRLKAMCDAC